MKSITLIGFLINLFVVSVVNAGNAEPNDPLESLNRYTYSFNDFLDRNLFRPVAVGYKTVTPDVMEIGISNFFSNLGEPLTIFNDLLQGKFFDAGSDGLRFLVNTTVGILGFIDIGSRIGLAKHDEDFGQTLGAWGVGSGPYLVLPFLGPSTVRDTFTRIPDGYMNPLSEVSDSSARIGAISLNLVNTRAKLLSAEAMMVGDRYTFIRDAYLQNRRFKVNDGKLDQQALDSYLDDDLSF